MKINEIINFSTEKKDLEKETKTTKKSTKKMKKTTKKKAAKKKTAPKKVAKKTTKKTHAPKILKDAPEEKRFFLCNGQIIKNIKELEDKLEHIEDEVFNHHVIENRNDFANWIRDVFKEVKLAEEISKLKNKNQIKLTINKYAKNKTKK